MKTTQNILFVSALATALSAVAAKPAVPQAPVITYGLVRDEYGAPLTKASAAALYLVKNDDRTGRVYCSASVGDSGIAGMNYRLSQEIDSSGPARDTAVVKDTVMFIKAIVGGIETPLRPTATFVTPAQGSKQRLDFAIGDDADNDGMPDDWEIYVLDKARRDSEPADVEAFLSGDDADGDGMTNYQEFMAGTNPFIATDLLKVETFEIVPGTDRAKVTFRTAVDRKYRVLMTDTLAAPNWTPVATTLTDGGDLVYEDYDGNGRMMTVYVDARLSPAFFRVAAN